MKALFSGVLGFGIGFILKEVLVSIIVHDAYDHDDTECKQILENYRDEGEKIEAICSIAFGNKAADKEADVVNFDEASAEQN